MAIRVSGIKWLSATEVANKLQVSPRTVQRWLDNGSIPIYGDIRQDDGQRPVEEKSLRMFKHPFNGYRYIEETQINELVDVLKAGMIL